MKKKRLLMAGLLCIMLLSGCAQTSDSAVESTSESSANTWECRECGEENDGGSFCGECGTKKGEKAEKTTSSRVDDSVEDVNDETSDTERIPVDTTKPVDIVKPTESTTSVVQEESSSPLESHSITLLGDSDTGYINLTAGEHNTKWLPFVDLSNPSQNEDIVSILQASNLTQDVILTIAAYDLDWSIVDFANSLYIMCEETGDIDVVGATVTIGGYDAKQIYCYYPDSEKYLVTWVFDTDKDDYIHYIAAEFTYEHSYATDVCESFHYRNGLGSLDFVPDEKPSGDENIVSDDTSIVSVEATLENPAKIGEWVEIWKYSVVDSDYHRCYVRLMNTVRGDEAQAIVDEFNEEHSYIQIKELEDDALGFGCTYYEVYFPEDYPCSEWGITSPDIYFSVCNENHSGDIGGYIGLSSTQDASEDADVYGGDVFNGRILYCMVDDFDEYYLTYDVHVDGKTLCQVYLDPTE